MGARVKHQLVEKGLVCSPEIILVPPGHLPRLIVECLDDLEVNRIQWRCGLERTASVTHSIRVFVEPLHELESLAQPDAGHRGKIVTARQDTHVSK